MTATATMPRWLVPYGWRYFRAKQRLLWRDAPVHALRTGLLRLLHFAALQGAWPLDNIFWPQWPAATPSQIIFILGHQRSGTTLLHRLLAADPRARALTLQEMLFPALSQQCCLRVAGWLDERLLHGAMARRLRSIQDRALADMDPIHRIRLHEIEEDEFVLWAIFASAMCANDTPAAAASEELAELRSLALQDPAWQERTLRYYRAFLLKKVNATSRVDAASTVWNVAKNPAFTKRIPQLARVFPEARFIYLHRDPLRAIPSRLRLVEAIWRQRFGPQVRMEAAQTQALLRDSLDTYLSAARDLPLVPPTKRYDMQYETFTADPLAEIAAVYAHFGLGEVPGEMENALRELHSARSTTPRGKRPAPPDFGLKDEDILGPLRGSLG
ncbi:MAG: sulfotransferase [Candidatus Hydrogenedentes bacterium]|nr:sulfotransferase [Candidatus Hydrogenedentota bacterium]